MAQPQIATIPLGQKLYLSEDPYSVSASLTEFKNGRLHQRGEHFVVANRFGLKQEFTLPNTGLFRAIYHWISQNLLFCVQELDVYVVNLSEVGMPTRIGTLDFVSSRKIDFVEFEGVLYIGGGGKIFRTGGTDLQPLEDATAPINSRFLTHINHYLVSGSDRDQSLRYSRPGDATVWNALDFVNANSSSDRLLRVIAKDNFLYAFGTETIEFWYPDLIRLSDQITIPFARRQDMTLDTGLLNSDLVEVFKFGFVYVSSDLDVIFLPSGSRDRRVVSKPIQFELRKLTRPSESFASSIYTDGEEFFIVTFISDKKTFVYNVTYDYWVEWTSITDNIETFFQGAFSTGRNRVGGTYFVPFSGNSIYSVDYTTIQDGTSPVRFSLETSQMNHDLSVEGKRHKRSSIRMASSSNHLGKPLFSIQTKVNNLEYSKPTIYVLDRSMARRNVVDVYPQGRYETLQYKIQSESNSPFSLIQIQEEFYPVSRVS